MDQSLAARLVRRWLMEHARHVRESAMHRLVLAGASDWQITSWLEASHSEIQEARSVAGRLPAFNPLTDAVNNAVWRRWVALGGGKSADVLLALHQDSGVSIQKLYSECVEWIRVDRAMGL